MRRRQTDDEQSTPLDVFLAKLRAREAAIGQPIRARSGAHLAPFLTPERDRDAATDPMSTEVLDR